MIKFLSFEFINVFALAIVSRVFPDLDIIKFKLIHNERKNYIIKSD